MASEKVRFLFVTEAGSEARSTVVKVKSIQKVAEEEKYVFSKAQQTKDKHPELFALKVVSNAIKSMTSRNKFRNVLVTLTGDLLSIYMDEEGNVVFHDDYLEEAPKETSAVESQAAGSSGAARSLAKDIVLERFNGKNYKASSWLATFVQECLRVGISQGKFAETLRLFLSDSALDWFHVFMKQESLEREWNSWSNSFIDTFDSQSWEEVEYAYNYKFLSGSLLDFALKKRSLLLETDEDLSICSQINLIVISLPKSIQSKLEKNKLKVIEDLFSSLKQIGSLQLKKKVYEKEEEKIPCGYCERQGFKNRYHPVQQCRLKKENSEIKSRGIRLVNNAELQNLITSSELSKNE